MIQKEMIKQYLLQVLNGAKLASAGTEIVCPCPFCGDPRPKFYVGPFDDSDQPITYNCFLCKVHGFVSQDFLDSIKVSVAIDPEVLKSNRGNGYKSKLFKTDRVYNLRWDYVTDNPLTQQKLQYVNKRLGLQLTYADCVANKIILNLQDLLDVNGITYTTRHPNQIAQLNTYFIGFLTRTNSSLNMRNLLSGSYKESSLDESLRMKYLNYRLFKDREEDDFFILPTTVDRTKPIRLFLAEGAFDVLGIKYNLIKSDDNCIYTAGKGKAYESALFWVIKTIAPMFMEVHMFPDKDVETSFIQNIISKYYVYGYKFFIHRNTYPNQKDYGVPEWQINDSYFKV